MLGLNDCNEARGYAVLAGLKSLDLLVLPQVSAHCRTRNWRPSVRSAIIQR